MNKNKVYIFSLLLLSCLVACKGETSNKQISEVVTNTENSIETIDLTKIRYSDNIPLSFFADSVSYVQLSDDILLGEIKYVTQIDDKELLIYTRGLVYRYDMDGKFISKIFSSGRGPNEAICHTKPVLNRERRTVSVRNYVGTDFVEFNFERKVVSRSPKMGAITKAGRATIYKVSNNGNIEITYQIYKDNRNSGEYNPYPKNIMEVWDKDADSLIYGYPTPNRDVTYLSKTGHMRQAGSSDVFAGKSNDKYWFMLLDTDTLFMTSDFKDVHPKYLVKTYEPRWDFTESMKMRLGQADKSKVDEFHYNCILMAGRFGLFQFINDSKFCLAVIDTHSLEGIGSEKRERFDEMDLINDIDYTADIDSYNMLINGSYYDNKLYIPINADLITENEKSDKFTNLAIDSNPVIVVIHLKK